MKKIILIAFILMLARPFFAQSDLGLTPVFTIVPCANPSNNCGKDSTRMLEGVLSKNSEAWMITETSGSTLLKNFKVIKGNLVITVSPDDLALEFTHVYVFLGGQSTDIVCKAKGTMTTAVKSGKKDTTATITIYSGDAYSPGETYAFSITTAGVFCNGKQVSVFQFMVSNAASKPFYSRLDSIALLLPKLDSARNAANLLADSVNITTGAANQRVYARYKQASIYYHTLNIQLDRMMLRDSAEKTKRGIVLDNPAWREMINNDIKDSQARITKLKSS